MKDKAGKKDLSADDASRISEAAQDWFFFLADASATQRDRDRFDAWLKADPRHEAAYHEIRTAWDEAGPLRAAFASAPHQADIQSVDKRDARPSFTWGLATAACLAIAVFIGPHIAINLQADHVTGVGEQTRIALPDRSVAFLNTDTAIAVRFEEGARNIALLRGEAQFDVAHDASRPFSVSAQGGRSTALGTVFTVRDHAGRVRSSVSEGRIEVASPADAAGGSARLSAGDAVFYLRGKKPEPVDAANAAGFTAWRDGLIRIETMALKDALAEIDRYRPGRIVLLAENDRLKPVTARLSIEALDEGIDALAATNGLTVTRITDYLVIIR